MTDSRNARDDRGLERLLRDARPPGEPGEGASCLDADTVAAWCDGGLTAAERESAEMHAAGCARCQAMLAVMLRTEPPAAAQEPSAIRRRMMMLGPALAAAAAVTIWFAVDRPAPSFDDSTASSTAAVGEPPVAASPLSPAPSMRDAPMTHAAQKEAELALADAVRENERRTDPRPPAPMEPAATTLARRAKEEARDKDAGASRQAAESVRAEAGGVGGAIASRPAPAPAASPSAGALAETVQVTQASPPVAKSGDERQRAEPAPMQSQTQYTQQRAVQQRPDEQQTAGFASRDAATSARVEADRAAGRGAAGDRPQANALIAAAAKAADVVAFRSPDDSAWWRITSGRVAQQSTDRGATWTTRYAADEKTSLTAGVAASSSTVWMVGRAGTVLVTTDGRVWRRRPFPESTDLIAVTAVDGRTATVISADGRSFATADAGATWTRK